MANATKEEEEETEEKEKEARMIMDPCFCKETSRLWLDEKMRKRKNFLYNNRRREDFFLR